MIHPTAIIEDGVQLGADCEIHAYAIVKRGTVLGARVVVHSFAVVGGDRHVHAHLTVWHVPLPAHPEQGVTLVH